MNLQQLRYFQQIAERQQYTLAAEDLYVTQATLSLAIKNLEQELNVKLFERKGKYVTLTQCGKAYLSCVRDALQMLDRGERMVKNMSSPAKAVVKLSYLASLKRLTAGLISDLRAQEAGAQLRLDLSNYTAPVIEQMLARGETDLGISSTPASAAVSSHLIGYQDNVVVLPKRHPWAEMDSIPLSLLDGQPYIAYNQNCAIRGYYDSIFELAHVYPEILAEARFDSNILDMVSCGMGVSIVPRMPHLERSDLLTRPLRDRLPPRAICLLWAKGAALPAQADEFRQRIIDSPNLSRYL